MLSPAGPCALTSINAVTQCGSDVILVDWEVVEGTSQYVVTAEDHEQNFINCESNSTSCELQGVRCGMHYSIIVSTSSDKCQSLRSPPKNINTGIWVLIVIRSLTFSSVWSDKGAIQKEARSP